MTMNNALIDPSSQTRPLSPAFQSEAEAILRILKKEFSDFTGYASASIHRRMFQFMVTERISSAKELRERIFHNSSYAEKLCRALTVNFTELFRDPSFFRALKEKVFPYLATYPSIKIWHAGCSTGEEVFSLAILLHETGLLNKTNIYATDCNEEVLEKAASGIMPVNRIQNSTGRYTESGGNYALANYYSSCYNKIIFHDFLKERIHFFKHNLVTDESMQEFNLVLCRNVLIYFNPELQSRVLTLCLNSLTNLGYLGTGIRENVHLVSAGRNLRKIDSDNKIYRKIIMSDM